MDMEQVGQFIAELRKSHQMTQKDLAEKLDVSDKAVSKWERGLSCPDIALLSPLANILGVTTTELLNGERAGAEAVSVEISVGNALEYVSRAAMSKMKLTQSIWAAIFSILLLLGIAVVSIVDLAISGTLTWALIPISASVFAWLLLFPLIKFGLKGIIGSCLALTLATVPFLYVLDVAVNRLLASSEPIFALGIRVAPLTIALAWITFFLFKKLWTRKLLAIAILVLLAIPINIFINAMISDLLDQPLVDVWTVVNAATAACIALILFGIDFALHRKSTRA